jgi:hypothetical protein
LDSLSSARARIAADSRTSVPIPTERIGTPEHWAQWLDPRIKDADDLRSLMAPPTGLEIYAVSTAVNDVRRTNGPHLLDPASCVMSICGVGCADPR